jgi:hypothetical protein
MRGRVARCEARPMGLTKIGETFETPAVLGVHKVRINSRASLDVVPETVLTVIAFAGDDAKIQDQRELAVVVGKLVMCV